MVYGIYMVHIYGTYIYTVFKRKNIGFNIFCPKASSVELKFLTCYISLLSFIYIYIYTHISRHTSTDIYTHIYIAENQGWFRVNSFTEYSICLSPKEYHIDI